MSGMTGHGGRSVKIEDADLELIKPVPRRKTRLPKNYRPLEKLGGTLNLPSVFSGKPDPSVHKHRLKRYRDQEFDEARHAKLARRKEMNEMITKKRERAAEARDIQNLARQFAIPAIQAMVDILENPGSSDTNKLAAANTLLDRAYGKSPVTNLNINASLDSKPEELDVDALTRRVADTLKEVEKGLKRTSEEGESEERPTDVRKYN
jgi:hypothetical protein